MRVLRTSILLLLAAASSCAVPRRGEEPRLATLHGPPLRGYDALHYDLDLRVNGDRRYLRGRCRMEFRALEDLSRVQVDAVDLTFLEVRAGVGAGEVACTWGENERILEVRFPEPLPAGTVAWIETDYTASPEAGMYFILPGEKGLDHIPQVYTQGEAVDARRWFPCNDHPADRASHSLTATVPASWTTVAAGTRTGRELDPGAGTVTESWSLEEEMPVYLFTFAAGPFAVLHDAWQDVEIWYVCEPDDAAWARISLETTPDVLRFFSEYTRFRYPWDKYATTCVRDFPYGGMENVTATTITRGSLAPPEFRREFSAEGLVAHEAAHQWFGDIVTCAEWPHVWLNEGFATYFTQLWFRDRYGEDEFLVRMGNTIDAYTRACRGDNLRPVVKYPYRAPMDLFFDGTVYPGGAARLQLLRGWIGEDRFRQVLAHYLSTNAFTSVETDAFRRSVEAVTGENWFDWFDTWLFAPGYPELEVDWHLEDGEIVVQVRQTQTGPDVPVAFPLFVELRRDGGPLERFWMEGRSAEFRLPAGDRPVRFLEVDPKAWLPARIRIQEPLEAARARALEGSTSRSRLTALAALREAGAADPGLLERLAREDPVPAVRAAAVRALGAFGARLDPESLRRAWIEEQEPAPRGAWFDLLAAAAAREPGLRMLLEEVLQNAHRSPSERARALRALAGFLSGEELRAFLRPWLETSTPREILRLAAMEVLARRLQDPVTRGTLLQMASRGYPTPVRARALDLLRPWLAEAQSERDAVVVRVRSLLDSPYQPLRRAAVAAAAAHPRFLRRRMEERLDDEPDARLRRVLERGLAGS